MANTLTIDTRLINLPWTTATTYRFDIDSGFVNEVGGNRSPNLALSNALTVTTYSSGPMIESISPPLNAINSYETTIKINYERAIWGKEAPNNNIFLYERNGAISTLISSIASTSSRVTTSIKEASINLLGLIDGSKTYYLTSENYSFADVFNFNAEIINESKLKFTTGAGPIITSVNPTYGSSSTFITSLGLTYNRNITKNSGNFYIYNQSGSIVNTIPVTSSTISTTSTTCTINITSYNLPENTYYLTTDKGTLVDSYQLPNLEINDNSVLKFTQVIITNLNMNRGFFANDENTIFATNTPQIIDIDSSATYTISISSPMGEFGVISTGTDVLSNWSYSGNKSQVNSIFSQIKFYPTKDFSTNTSFTLLMNKNGISQVNKTNNLLGSSSTFSTTNLEFKTSTVWIPSYKYVKYGKIDILLVGGGGGGAADGGAGGGGGVLEIFNQPLSIKPYQIIIGSGGLAGYEQGYLPDASATGGGNTQFDSHIAYGGGPGIQMYPSNTYGRGRGGSSGSPTSYLGGQTFYSSGFDGQTGSSWVDFFGGGGGGSGGNAPGYLNGDATSVGGNGYLSTITGLRYASGGNAPTVYRYGPRPNTKDGGGGRGAYVDGLGGNFLASNGIVNTGGGGGSGGINSDQDIGRNGGSGYVYIRIHL